VDYLGIQGYWVCTIVALMTQIVALFAAANAINARQLITILSFFGMISLFFYIGGIGVREGSRFAAVIAFVVYALDTGALLLTSPVSANLMIRSAITVVLLSNLPATWVAAGWVPGTEESALPLRRSEAWGDRFVDQCPQWIWPKIRLPYYALSALVASVACFGYVGLLFGHAP
jgi:hypothetical protein